MVFFRAVVIAVGIAVASGCAATHQFPGSAAESATGGTARGIGGTVGSFLATAMSRMGSSKEVLIFSVNGAKVNTLGAVKLVRLTSGTHRLNIGCAFQVEGRLIQQHADISLEVVDGHIYQLDATPPCSVAISDSTHR